MAARRFWTAQLGDGIALAAGPLLVTSQTDSAVLGPWLRRCSGCRGWRQAHAGAIADRLDRKRVTIAMDLARVMVLLVLCGFISPDG